MSRYKVAVVGSGPAGLSAAAPRGRARRVRTCCSSREQHLRTRSSKYQKGKHVMAEPSVLPLRSPVSFAAGKREEILEQVGRGGRQAQGQHPLRRGGDAPSPARRAPSRSRPRQGETLARPSTSCCAIGLQGNLRKLGVPGEDLEMRAVPARRPGGLRGRDDRRGRRGRRRDRERARARRAEPRRSWSTATRSSRAARRATSTLVLAAIREGKIELPLRHLRGAASRRCPARARAGASLRAAEPATAPRRHRLRPRHRAPGRDAAAQARRELRRALPQRRRRRGAARSRRHYESNVPGLYIVGALGGYPLIKQAMNQGYEVGRVRSSGATVEPADEPLLEEKFASFPRDGERLARRSTLVQTAGAAASPASHACSCASSCSRARCTRRRAGEVDLQAQRLHQHASSRSSTGEVAWSSWPARPAGEHLRARAPASSSASWA